MRRISAFLGFVVLFTALGGLFGTNRTALAGTGPGPYTWQLESPASYPPDPTADLAWSSGFSGVADIQSHFNAARAAENAGLGLSIPMLTLPSQAEWDAMSEPQRALWLLNHERVDRGIPALDGLEANVSGVAQTYAEYLLAHNVFSHTADGRDPWGRLDANPAIGACHDFLSIAENLAYFATSGSSIPLSLERSVYAWMYNDGGCCAWGHRHAILWYPYTENGGSPSSEGFLGIGRAKGGPYQGLNYAEITVMNVFDPCSAWPYTAANLTISGRVTDGQGNGLPGVSISAGAAGSLETGADGSYAFTNLAPGAYTLTPSLSGYIFNPPSRQVTLTNADAPGQDFVASAAPTLSISGRVTDGLGTGLAGVVISASAAGSVETGADGSYAFTGLAPGSYTLIPSLSGYSFTPPSRQVTLTGAGATGQDFVAAPAENRPITLYLPVMVLPRSGPSATPNAGIWSGVSLVDGQPGNPNDTTTTLYEFSVNTDQKTLAYFKISFHVYGCPGSYQFDYTKPVSVINGKFAVDNFGRASETSKYSFDGGFYTPDTARGSMQLIKYQLEGCGAVTGEGQWAATRTK